MAKHIFKCEKCKLYTMNEICEKCNEKTVRALPPKYSPDDKYAKYRREAKKDELLKEGVL